MKTKTTPAAGPKPPGPDDCLSKREAIALIADRIKDPKLDDDRTAKNRARARIDAHLKTGKLVFQEEDRFNAKVLGTWLMAAYPGVFDDWPTDGPEVPNSRKPGPAHTTSKTEELAERSRWRESLASVIESNHKAVWALMDHMKPEAERTGEARMQQDELMMFLLQTLLQQDYVLKASFASLAPLDQRDVEKRLKAQENAKKPRGKRNPD